MVSISANVRFQGSADIAIRLPSSLWVTA